MWIVFRMIQRLWSDRAITSLAVVIRCSLFSFHSWLRFKIQRGGRLRLLLSASLQASERARGLHRAVHQAQSLLFTLGFWVKCQQGRPWDCSKGLCPGSALTSTQWQLQTGRPLFPGEGRSRLTASPDMELRGF